MQGLVRSMPEAGGRAEELGGHTPRGGHRHIASFGPRLMPAVVSRGNNARKWAGQQECEEKEDEATTSEAPGGRDATDHVVTIVLQVDGQAGLRRCIHTGQRGGHTSVLPGAEHTLSAGSAPAPC